MNKRTKKKVYSVPGQRAKFARLDRWIVSTGLARAVETLSTYVGRGAFEIVFKKRGMCWNICVEDRSPRRACIEAMEIARANNR